MRDTWQIEDLEATVAIVKFVDGERVPLVTIWQKQCPFGGKLVRRLAQGIVRLANSLDSKEDTRE